MHSVPLLKRDHFSEESEKIALLDEAIAISEGLNDDKYNAG